MQDTNYIGPLVRPAGKLEMQASATTAWQFATSADQWHGCVFWCLEFLFWPVRGKTPDTSNTSVGALECARMLHESRWYAHVMTSFSLSSCDLCLDRPLFNFGPFRWIWGAASGRPRSQSWVVRCSDRLCVKESVGQELLATWKKNKKKEKKKQMLSGYFLPFSAASCSPLSARVPFRTRTIRP